MLSVVAERLHAVTVYVSNNDPRQQMPTASEMCAYVWPAFPSGATRRVICTNPVSGRYVIVTVAGAAEILTLCEVQVYGVPGKALIGQ